MGLAQGGLKLNGWRFFRRNWTTEVSSIARWVFSEPSLPAFLMRRQAGDGGARDRVRCGGGCRGDHPRLPPPVQSWEAYIGTIANKLAELILRVSDLAAQIALQGQPGGILGRAWKIAHGSGSGCCRIAEEIVELAEKLPDPGPPRLTLLK